MAQGFPIFQRLFQDDRPGMIEAQAVGHPKFQSYFRGKQRVQFFFLLSLPLVQIRNKTQTQYS
jgi:hypothetical protein